MLDDLEMYKLEAEIGKLRCEVKILKRPFWQKSQWLGALFPIILSISSLWFFFGSEIGRLRKQELDSQNSLWELQAADFKKDSLELENKSNELSLRIRSLDNKIIEKQNERSRMLEEKNEQDRILKTERKIMAQQDQRVLNKILKIQEVKRAIFNLNDSARVLNEKLSQFQHWLHDEEDGNRGKRQKLNSLNLLNL